MMDRLSQIRQAEAASHRDAYASNELFAPGSWLAKPVKTVLDLLPLFGGYDALQALDLGCGVGRNCIPVARFFRGVPCRIQCVDILDQAIEKLNENARRYDVAQAIQGVVSSIDDYEIQADHFDLIMAISALEHTDSEAAFIRKLEQIRDGLRRGGIACLIVNANVRELDKATARELMPQFEVNLQTGELQNILGRVFTDWEPIKHTVAHQKYEIPREKGAALLETDVVTFVARK